MAKHKICPNCGTKNPVDEIFCITCFANIADVIPEEELEEEKDTSKKADVQENKQKTTNTDFLGSETNFSDDVEKTMIITGELVLKNAQFSIVVRPGDIVGRHFNGSQYLQSYKTVSRRHARFTKEMGKWYVEDLESTNGTYLNGERLVPGRKYEISNGSMITLSTEVKFTVEIKR